MTKVDFKELQKELESIVAPYPNADVNFEEKVSQGGRGYAEFLIFIPYDNRDNFYKRYIVGQYSQVLPTTYLKEALNA